MCVYLHCCFSFFNLWIPNSIRSVCHGELNSRPCVRGATSWPWTVSVVSESEGLAREERNGIKGVCHSDLVRLGQSCCSGSYFLCYESYFRAKRTGSPFRTCLEHGLTGNCGVSHRVKVLMASYGTKTETSFFE